MFFMVLLLTGMVVGLCSWPEECRDVVSVFVSAATPLWKTWKSSFYHKTCNRPRNHPPDKKTPNPNSPTESLSSIALGCLSMSGLFSPSMKWMPLSFRAVPTSPLERVVCWTWSIWKPLYVFFFMVLSFLGMVCKSWSESWHGKGNCGMLQR